MHYGVYRFANPSSGCNSCFRLDHTLPEWQLVEYLFLSEHLIRSKPNGVGRCNGRICLPFSLAWGVLGALAVRLVQPALAALAAGIPSAVTNTVLLCLGIDALWSTGVLLRWGDIDLLAPSRLRRKYRTA